MLQLKKIFKTFKNCAYLFYVYGCLPTCVSIPLVSACCLTAEAEQRASDSPQLK